MARFRNVCFTLNNWTEEDKVRLVANDDISYICYGEEVGESGTKHLQGYCEFTKQYGLKKVKALLGERTHVEKRKGSQKQAIDYCKKDGIFFEVGEKKEQGSRSDLEHIRESVKQGTTQIEVINQCQNFQQIRYCEKLYEYKPLSPEYKKKEVYWFWGGTGLGKTRAAYDLIKDRKLDFWRSTLDGSKWFNGYWGQPAAILDEVRAAMYPYVAMLQILDGYEMRLPYKGGFCIWNPDVIIITSPVKPEDCYKGQMDFNDGGIDQLLRRITEVREFKAPIEPTVPTMFLKRTREDVFLEQIDEDLEDYCERNHHGKRGV